MDILFYITLWSYKIFTLIIGYLFARLGYNLLIKGVTGEFKFKGEIKGVKADLVSASPGLFFILMGTIIVGIALYKGISIDVDLPSIIQKENKNIEETIPEFKPLPLPGNEKKGGLK